MKTNSLNVQDVFIVSFDFVSKAVLRVQKEGVKILWNKQRPLNLPTNVKGRGNEKKKMVKKDLSQRRPS